MRKTCFSSSTVVHQAVELPEVVGEVPNGFS